MEILAGNLTDIQPENFAGEALKVRNYKSERAEEVLNQYNNQKTVTDAVYLGVYHYGFEDVNKDTKNSFSYRFELDGKEEILKVDNGIRNQDGTYSYPIQNCLKEGYTYEIHISDGTVTAAEETTENFPAERCSLPVTGIPGRRTLKNFLSTAFMPVGTTLYVYGGGWNWQDTGAGSHTTSIGISRDWTDFFQMQDENYTYRDRDGNENLKNAANSYYPYGGYNEYYYAGLDCSGYLGWIIYNVMNTENGRAGWVMNSTKLAKTLAENGWGEWTQEVEKPADDENSSFLPGDVISISGHVWICVGTCEDGSILILHSTPALSRTGQPGGGPELTAVGEDENCDAYRLADQYMSQYFPEWYKRYPVAVKNFADYTNFEGNDAGKFSWNFTGENGGLCDPDHYRDMTPQEILEDLFILGIDSYFHVYADGIDIDTVDDEGILVESLLEVEHICSEL